MRKVFAIAVGLAVLVITPYFLLVDDEPSFAYGATELRAAIEGTWELVPEDGAARPITLQIEQARAPKQSRRSGGLVRSAAACSTRSLVRSAEACTDTTWMQLRILVDGREYGGMFSVDSTVFEVGLLQLSLGDHSYRAQIAKTGKVLELSNLRSLRRVSAP